MLLIAFVCFFALVVAWLLAPTGAQVPESELATPAGRQLGMGEAGA